MKLYYFPGAPSPLKVGIVISEKGLEIPTIVVNLRSGEHRTEEFAATHPEMTLPVLELDDGTRIAALVDRGDKRIEAFFDGLDKRLGESPYLATDRYTFADIAALVYLGFAERVTGQDPAEGREHVRRWADEIKVRPAIASL